MALQCRRNYFNILIEQQVTVHDAARMKGTEVQKLSEHEQGNKHSDTNV